MFDTLCLSCWFVVVRNVCVSPKISVKCMLLSIACSFNNITFPRVPLSEVPAVWYSTVFCNMHVAIPEMTRFQVRIRVFVLTVKSDYSASKVCFRRFISVQKYELSNL